MTTNHNEILMKTSRCQKHSRAFTLVEIMVVVVIIGILAATIIPKFMTTAFDAKVSAAKGHVAELQAALERFYVHMDRYPTTEEGLKVLVEAPANDKDKWRGPYIEKCATIPGASPINTAFPVCIFPPAMT
jgi:general secretion pathway protein G